jgi:hypothetical protein
MKFTLREAGTVERLMPMTETLTEHGRPATERVSRDHVGLVEVEVFQLNLPNFALKL